MLLYGAVLLVVLITAPVKMAAAKVPLTFRGKPHVRLPLWLTITGIVLLLACLFCVWQLNAPEIIPLEWYIFGNLGLSLPTVAALALIVCPRNWLVIVEPDCLVYRSPFCQVIYIPYESIREYRVRNGQVSLLRTDKRRLSIPRIAKGGAALDVIQKHY